MKKFIGVFLTIFAISSAASAKTIAELPVRMNGAVAIVEIDSDRTMTVAKYKLAPWRFGGDVEMLDRVEMELDEELFTRLQFNVIGLSNAELDVRHSEVVCLMMPPPGPSADLKVRRGHDRHKGFLGELEVVQTQRGCWAQTHVSLKVPYLNNQAHQLRGSLEALAFQALSK